MSSSFIPRRRIDPILTLLIGAAALIALTIMFLLIRETAAFQQEGNRNATRIAIVAYNGTVMAARPTVTATIPTMPPTWTPLPSSTPEPTHTPRPSDTPSITPTATITTTPEPTETPAPTATSAPTLRPSPLPPEALALIAATAAPANAQNGQYDYFNILLVGSDQRPAEKYFRTDTLIIVSINRTTQTVALLSLPRDLYVNIDRHGFDRINTAYEFGELMRYPGGGIELLIKTITATTGVPIQRYAKIDFLGFKQIVDGIGGVEVANDCPLTDYRLIPGRQEGIEANYRWSTLPVGVHHFGGIDALWFARSRYTTSDFDRARRQQVVLRAIYRKATEGGLITKLPALWGEVVQLVETNLSLADIASLLPLATEIDASRLKSYVLGPPAVADSVSPGGAMVVVPQPIAVRDVITRFYTPPTSNSSVAEKPTIEIWNASSHEDWDEVAAARLAWEGFVPLLKGPWAEDQPTRTTLYDFTGKAKPGSLGTLTRVFTLRAAQLNNAPDPNAATDFRLIIGNDYVSCTYRGGN